MRPHTNYPPVTFARELFGDETPVEQGAVKGAWLEPVLPRAVCNTAQILSQPGLGPDPNRAFVEARIMDIVLSLAAGGIAVFHQEVWRFMIQCAQRGLVDLTSEDIANAPPVRELLSVVPGSRSNLPSPSMSVDDANGAVATWEELANKTPWKHRTLAQFIHKVVRDKKKDEKPTVLVDLEVDDADGGESTPWVSEMVEWHQTNVEKALQPERNTPQQENTGSGESNVGRGEKRRRSKSASNGNDNGSRSDRGGHNLRNTKKRKKTVGATSEGHVSKKKHMMIDLDEYLESLPEENAPSPWEHLESPVSGPRLRPHLELIRLQISFKWLNVYVATSEGWALERYPVFIWTNVCDFTRQDADNDLRICSGMSQALTLTRTCVAGSFQLETRLAQRPRSFPTRNISCEAL